MTSDFNGQTSPVDFSRIQDTSDGDTEFEQELFEAYLEDCADRIDRLKEANAANDAEALRREAHTIKGASANVGTTRLHEIALEIERGEATDAESLHGLIAAIETEFELVRSAINDYLAEIGG